MNFFSSRKTYFQTLSLSLLFLIVLDSTMEKSWTHDLLNFSLHSLLKKNDRKNLFNENIPCDLGENNFQLPDWKFIAEYFFVLLCSFTQFLYNDGMKSVAKLMLIVSLAVWAQGENKRNVVMWVVICLLKFEEILLFVMLRNLLPRNVTEFSLPSIFVDKQYIKRKKENLIITPDKKRWCNKTNEGIKNTCNVWKLHNHKWTKLFFSDPFHPNSTNSHWASHNNAFIYNNGFHIASSPTSKWRIEIK